MQEKLLTDLVEELTGEGNERIVPILFGKKDVNEFTLANKMEMTINQVRNILYKLSADGLVVFIRKKDKRKGWYIYYWTLKTQKCLEKIEESLMRKIAAYEASLQSRETERFYVCQSCDIEVSEEKALEHGFSCEECAEIYELSDNSKPIRDTKALITRTQKELELIRVELSSIREKERRKRERAERKSQKELAHKKELLKKARALARKKVAKKTVKKTAKKAVKKTAKKTAKKVGKKATAKTAKKVAKKTVKKTAKKTAKKNASKRNVGSLLKRAVKQVKKATKQ